MKRAVIYFGFNHPRKHKRGVENVIHVQSMALPMAHKFYLFFDDAVSISRWQRIACIGIKRGPLRMFRLNLLLLALLWRLRRADVVLHSHNFLMSLFACAGTDLFSVHDGLHYQMRSLGRRCPCVFQLIERVVYRRCRVVHFNSQYTRQMSEYPSKRPAHVIYCSSHLECFAPIPPKRLCPGEALHIVCVRSMEARARIDLLLEVAEQFARESRTVRITVAGKGPLLQHFRDEIVRRKIPNIRLLGFVPDQQVAELYASADLVLMTCEHGEGFGLPVIEAWLFDRPAVASNRCAVPEVLADERFLCENSAASICARIDAVLDLSRQINFRALYDERFSQRHIVSQFRLLYESVFASRGCLTQPLPTTTPMQASLPTTLPIPTSTGRAQAMRRP